MKRPRHCGRFAYWALPMGPWRCTECDVGVPGDMPKNARERFLDWAEEYAAKLPKLTVAQETWAKQIASSTKPIAVTGEGRVKR